jgi:hypothetical protein
MNKLSELTAASGGAVRGACPGSLERYRISGGLRPCRAAGVLPLIVALALPLAPADAEDVVLDPDATQEGVVGLYGEAFASGYMYAYPDGATSSFASFGSDGQFSIGVPAGKGFRLFANMQNFQGTGNARVTHEIRNLPPMAEGEIRSIDLRRASGRVEGSVNVTGGTLWSLAMSSYSQDGNVPEYFSGSVSVTGNAGPAIQPMPVVPGQTRVSGSARIDVDQGCSTVVSLPWRYVTIADSLTVAVEWDVDVSGVSCAEGSVEGNVELSGLGLADPDAQVSRHTISMYGQSTYTVQITEDGPYSIGGMLEGTYSTRRTSQFHEPYSSLSSRYYPNALAVTGGEVTTFDHIDSVGTARRQLDLNGSWGLSDPTSTLVHMNASDGAYAHDVVDPASGEANLILTPSNWRTSNWYFFFSTPGAAQTANQSTYFFPPYRLDAGPAEGASIVLPNESLETSDTEVTFTIAQPDGLPPVQIARLNLRGQAYPTDPQSGQGLGQYSIYLYTYGSLADVLQVPVYGFPGTYAMEATGQGSDGQTYRKFFELVLGSPLNTPTGDPEPIVYESVAGEEVTVDFGNVTETGVTTVSELTLGPPSPEGFVIASRNNQGDPLYFDITTTATFTGQVQVCMTYDDAGMTQGEENTLELHHYTCDANGENCLWDPITEAGYPDTDTNRICGLTDSFSLFAIMAPIIVDTDGDGVLDDVDNCPLSANADQSDLDADGIGDACDQDSDGDGIVNDEDLCPALATQDNADLDGDGIGNPCDDDKDGDSVLDVADNCPLTANQEQVDFDADGAGDACDIDDDGDFVLDSDDLCPGTAPDAQIDGDGCASDQRQEKNCPSDAEWRNHGQYVSCVSHEADEQVEIGLITRQEASGMVSSAARSDIGKK